MDVQITLPAELGIDTREFIAAWNETPECRAAAHARSNQPVMRGIDPATAASAMAVLGSVAASLATNALYDLIKHALTRKGVKKRTEIEEVQRPDGTKVIVVKIVE